jgi:hypothetical protein
MIKNTKYRQIFLITCEIAFIFFISFLFYFSRPITTSKVVFIPKGGVIEIITYLNQRNFDVNKIDMLGLFFLGYVQSGWIDIGERNLSKIDFLYKLTTAKAAMSEITLIPGETTAIFLKELANKFGLNEESLNFHYSQLAPWSEGFLIPETYKIPIGISERHLMYYLINYSQKNHTQNSIKIFGEYDEKRWQNLIIIASIIQKEAADDSEFALIGSVIQNRLKNNMKLQMDGTLNYGFYSHDKVTADRIKEDKSKFNTYLNYGLPPVAICTVSIAAIKAAINPAKSEFLYFVRDRNTGKHKFSKTYEQHNQNIQNLVK